jgi:streptogramin lyase
MLPSAVAAGPDGNMWFAQRGGVGTITPAGVATLFKVDGILSSISAGPDGNLWFTENFRGKIGRATPSGQIVLFDIPTRPGGGGSNPHSIAAGPDGNLWFTESNVGANKIGRITPAGVITEFSVPTAGSPRGIAAGPDGNLWFTADSGSNEGKVGSITPAGVITEYTLPLKKPQPMTIVSGPDGNLWLTETNNPANKVARITPAGSVTEFQVPTGFSGPSGLTVGPDGNLWFTERSKGKIGRLQVAAEDVRYVLHLASGFVPSATTVAQGQAVQWINQVPGLSSVRQANTAPIFDSSSKATGSSYAIRFAVAGTYAYTDHAHASHTGTVTVPMTVAPESGAPTTNFVVTWATGAEPVVSRGWVIDVQVATPGVADFVPWQDGVTTQSAPYTPTAGNGLYRLRTRLRHATAKSASDWSPVVSITVR